MVKAVVYQHLVKEDNLKPLYRHLSFVKDCSLLLCEIEIHFLKGTAKCCFIFHVFGVVQLKKTEQIQYTSNTKCSKTYIELCLGHF